MGWEFNQDESTTPEASRTITFVWVPSFPGEPPASKYGRLSATTTGSVHAQTTELAPIGPWALVSSYLDGGLNFQDEAFCFDSLNMTKNVNSGTLVSYKGPFQAPTFDLSASVHMVSTAIAANEEATTSCSASSQGDFTVTLDLKP